MKKFFQKIGKFFKALWFGLFVGDKEFKEFLEGDLDDILAITEKIKWLIVNPVIFTIADLFPGKWGTKAKPIFERIEKVLLEVLDQLEDGKICINKLTLLERLQCFINLQRKKSEIEINSTMSNIATLYLMKMSAMPDSEIAMKVTRPLKEGECKDLIQMRLREKKESAAAA